MTFRMCTCTLYDVNDISPTVTRLCCPRNTAATLYPSVCRCSAMPQWKHCNVFTKMPITLSSGMNLLNHKFRESTHGTTLYSTYTQTSQQKASISVWCYIACLHQIIYFLNYPKKYTSCFIMNQRFHCPRDAWNNIADQTLEPHYK